MTPRIARALHLERNNGVLVYGFDSSSPAEESGIQLYDVIVEAEGVPFKTREDYLTWLYDFRPGDSVRLRVLRNGTLEEV